MKSFKYDYHHVEDTAGVEFKTAMIVTAAFLLFSFFGFEIISSVPVFTVVSTVLGAGVWWYFRRYFRAVGDRHTATMVFWIMLTMVVTGVGALFFGMFSSFESATGSVQANLGFAGIGSGLMLFVDAILILCIVVFVSGIRIILVNRHHRFPLKRIAVSAMVCVPLYILFLLFTNFTMLREGLDFFQSYEDTNAYAAGTEAAIGSGVRYFLMFALLPYYFLLHHFYRADRANAQLEPAPAVVPAWTEPQFDPDRDLV